MVIVMLARNEETITVRHEAETVNIHILNFVIVHCVLSTLTNVAVMLVIELNRFVFAKLLNFIRHMSCCAYVCHVVLLT